LKFHLKAVKYAKEKGYNVVIVDTAGRLAVDEEMMTKLLMFTKRFNRKKPYL
jgi:signal recognition particle subunit SRP54